MKVHSAEFVIGAASPSQFPPSFLPEVAFAGKSNVGKSSLINFLLNRKKLVKTSSTPGKTRQINFFLINEKFRLVDLPGYGFARAPKSEQAQWHDLIEGYLRNRQFLRGVVLIVDPRHDSGPLDMRMVSWLNHYRINMRVVASKYDKLKKKETKSRLDHLQRALSLSEKPLAYSTKAKLGREALWDLLETWLEEIP